MDDKMFVLQRNVSIAPINFSSFISLSAELFPFLCFHFSLRHNSIQESKRWWWWGSRDACCCQINIERIVQLSYPVHLPTVSHSSRNEKPKREDAPRHQCQIIIANVRWCSHTHTHFHTDKRKKRIHVDEFLLLLFSLSILSKSNYVLFCDDELFIFISTFFCLFVFSCSCELPFNHNSKRKRPGPGSLVSSSPIPILLTSEFKSGDERSERERKRKRREKITENSKIMSTTFPKCHKPEEKTQERERENEQWEN